MLVTVLVVTRRGDKNTVCMYIQIHLRISSPCQKCWSLTPRGCLLSPLSRPAAYTTKQFLVLSTPSRARRKPFCLLWLVVFVQNRALLAGRRAARALTQRAEPAAAVRAPGCTRLGEGQGTTPRWKHINLPFQHTHRTAANRWSEWKAQASSKASVHYSQLCWVNRRARIRGYSPSVRSSPLPVCPSEAAIVNGTGI